jgi:uncharacterized protein (DUF1778 family)
MPALEIRNVKLALESATARTAELLPDRRRFELGAERWNAFEAAMDAPMKAALRLQQLLRTPSVFERGGSGHSGETG